MRKNHHGKKDRLVKRVFALCLALAVICTCLVPVFATEGLIDPQVNQEASRPVEDGEASYPDDEVAGFGEDFPAVDDGAKCTMTAKLPVLARMKLPPGL